MHRIVYWYIMVICIYGNIKSVFVAQFFRYNYKEQRLKPPPFNNYHNLLVYCFCENIGCASGKRVNSYELQMSKNVYLIIRIQPKSNELDKFLPLGCKYFSLAMTFFTDKEHGFRWFCRGYHFQSILLVYRGSKWFHFRPKLQPLRIFYPAESRTFGARFIKSIEVYHVHPPFMDNYILFYSGNSKMEFN